MKFARMQLAIPALLIGLMTVIGCQQQKPAPSASALDVGGSSGSLGASPAAPVSYAPPTQSNVPDATMSGSSTAAMSTAASANSYTVKHGDTLWKIAATHYGDGRKWTQIADANPGLTPSKLKVGQTINLP